MDEDAKRKVLRRIPYGMYVMTSIADGRPAASTLTWLSQCSFHPPLVMIGVQTNSLVHEAIERALLALRDGYALLQPANA